MTVVLEPFPLFIDSAPPEAASYFASPSSTSSKMGSNCLPTLEMSPSGRGLRDIPGLSKAARVSFSSRLTTDLRLRYYQYELTFGLYVMTPMEKIVLNSILLIVIGAISYGVYHGLEPFVVRSICRLIYYLTGYASFKVAPELCAQQSQ